MKIIMLLISLLILRTSLATVDNEQYPYVTDTRDVLSAEQLLHRANRLRELHSRRYSLRCVIFHTERGSGGLGDRLRGLVTTFFLAVVTDSRFSIQNAGKDGMAMGYSLQNFDVGCASSSKGVSEQLVDNYNYSFWHTSNFVRRWGKARHVHVHTNSNNWDAVLHNDHTPEAYRLALSGMSVLDLFRLALTFVAPRPSELVKSSIAHRLRSEKSFRVGVHIRLELSKWGESAQRYGSSFASVESVVGCFVNQTLLACQQQMTCDVYITADSIEAVTIFVSRIKGRTGISVISSSREAVHIDRSQNVTSEALIETFADWHMLTHMNHLLISRSGFSETASWYSMVYTEQLPLGGQGCGFHRYDNLYGPKIFAESVFSASR